MILLTLTLENRVSQKVGLTHRDEHGDIKNYV